MNNFSHATHLSSWLKFSCVPCLAFMPYAFHFTKWSVKPLPLGGGYKRLAQAMRHTLSFSLIL